MYLQTRDVNHQPRYQDINSLFQNISTVPTITEMRAAICNILVNTLKMYRASSDILYPDGFVV